MRPFRPALAALFRRAIPRKPKAPCPLAEVGRAIGTLERNRAITPAEAHALIAGEHLADLYADGLGQAGIDLRELEEIEALIRVGDLPETILQLGRLHPALRDLPHLFNRSAARARA